MSTKDDGIDLCAKDSVFKINIHLVSMYHE